MTTVSSLRFAVHGPALGPIDFREWLPRCGKPAQRCPHFVGLDWLVFAGESRPWGSRPCDLGWARSMVAQGKAAGVPVYVERIGSNPILEPGPIAWPASHPEGTDLAEWPADLRVQQWPEVRR